MNGTGVLRRIVTIASNARNSCSTRAVPPDAAGRHVSARLRVGDQRGAGGTQGEVPLGVVEVIAPWNYPLSRANNLIVPALVAGNSVVFKPDIMPIAAITSRCR